MQGRYLPHCWVISSDLCCNSEEIKSCVKREIKKNSIGDNGSGDVTIKFSSWLRITYLLLGIARALSALIGLKGPHQPLLLRLSGSSASAWALFKTYLPQPHPISWMGQLSPTYTTDGTIQLVTGPTSSLNKVSNTSDTKANIQKAQRLVPFLNCESLVSYPQAEGQSSWGTLILTYCCLAKV